jgi:hypothetical protein
VAAGSTDGFLAVPGANTVKLRWQFPGGTRQEKSVVLEGKPQRVAIGP